MFEPSGEMAHRVARRFRLSHSTPESRSQTFNWVQPGEDTNVHDYVVQLSEGSSVTTNAVEDVLCRTRDIVRGSCRFQDRHAWDTTNRVGFELWAGDGEMILGEVVVNAVAYNGMMTAYAAIEIAESARRGFLQFRSSHDLQSRRVYASRPWGYRLARVLYQARFAADPEGFGRLVYGVFLMLGVTGMPEAPRVPGTSREIDRLPRGYGHEFGLAARSLARRFFTDEGEVDDLLAAVGLKVLSDASLHRGIAGKPLSEARSYVFRAISNRARDMLRSNRVRRHDVLDEMVGDPASWTSLGRYLPEREIDQIKRELESVVSPRLLPDLPLYFDLLLDGHSNAEIAEKRLLPSLRERPISQQALAKYRSKIKQVLERHFDVQARVALHLVTQEVALAVEVNRITSPLEGIRSIILLP